MFRWVYYGMGLIIISLAFTWCQQILYTVPNDNHDYPIINSTDHRYFLHITDFHLDSHYLAGATVKSACHDLPSSLDSDSTEATAGSFGVPGCDTPVALAQKTLDWISKEFKDKLDFVVWTGDNARHDWDKRIKRSRSDVYESNRLMTKLMLDTFGANVPIIPTLGNNDVIPHNQITLGGQDKKTDKLLHFYQDLWDQWIPQDQRDDFLKYGAFVAEVGPRLRAVSLNSMYFIKKNKKLQGCRKPGTARQHMDWFQQQLEKAHVDGYQILVLGHVPPSEDNYRSSCLESYNQISSTYSDIIIGHLYGHLNKDHFLLYDTSRMDGRSSGNDTVMDHGVNQQHHSYQQQPMTISRNFKVPKFARQLHDMYASLHPRPEPLNHQGPLGRSAVVAIQVTPSVLPKYYPTVRLYRYTKNDQEAPKLIGYDQYFANITEWEQQPENHQQHNYQLLYSSFQYGMQDLSALSFFDLAKRMVDPGDKKGRQIWKSFVNNIFIQTRNIF